MYEPGLHFDILIVYFIYGGAFFTMGLAMALEIGRSPSLANADLLTPLAGFGILHGLHEWLEIYLLQVIWLGGTLPDWVVWLRLGLLAVSFFMLIIFGIQAFRVPRGRAAPLAAIGLGILALYILFILFNSLIAIRAGQVAWLRLADALARYLLAVPGALLASLGLHFQGLRAKAGGRRSLMGSLQWAAVGFGIYGLTQVFVPNLDMIPGRWINAEVFLATSGVPIQVFRAAMAVVVLVGMLHATRVVERERREQVQATQQARLEALHQIQIELTKREALRRDLLRHIVQVQEDERARIARELHDETAQILSAFSLDLATLKNIIPRKADAQILIARLQELGKQMSQGLYHLVHDLRPAQLDDLGLLPTLNSLVERDFTSKGLVVAFKIEGEVYRLDTTLETVLFRVVQEALANIIRHAKVKQACVQMVYSSDKITLRVMDSGVGFDPGEMFNPPRGWGLAGMRERVEAVDGLFYIHSAPGTGTTVEVHIPIGDQSEEFDEERMT